MKIEGYILDIDGTLLSSEDAHLRAWKRALREYGLLHSDHDIKSQFGQPTPTIAYILSGKKDFKVAETIALLKTEYFIEEIAKIPLYPGVSNILSQITQLGYPICFASSNYNRVIQTMYDTYGWKEISVGFVGIDDIVHSKPAPDMVFKAAEKMNVQIEKCVMIGDSKYDVLAGGSAGAKTIAICTKHSREFWGELEYQPDLVLDEFQELENKIPLTL